MGQNKWLFILILAAPAWAGVQDWQKPLPNDITLGKFRDAISLFEALNRQGKASGEDDYLAGYAYLRLNRFVEAQRVMELAQNNGFNADVGWPPPAALLARLSDIHRLTPADRQDKYPNLSLHAGSPTAWTGPVIEALPEFSRIGHEIYGDAVPDMDFYLFSNGQDYLDFFKAVFNRDLDTPWEDGTAGAHFAVYCESASRPAGRPETVGNVLHEFGHGWANSYVRLKYDKEYISLVAPWANEGMAGFVASLWDKDHMGRRRVWIQQHKVAKGIPPPTFEELQTPAGFYHGDSELHYWMGDFLFERLIGPNGASKIPAYLDALVRTGDSNKALAEVSGLDPAREYQDLVAEIWHQPKPRSPLWVGLIPCLLLAAILYLYCLKKRTRLGQKASQTSSTIGRG